MRRCRQSICSWKQRFLRFGRGKFLKAALSSIGRAQPFFDCGGLQFARVSDPIGGERAEPISALYEKRHRREVRPAVRIGHRAGSRRCTGCARDSGGSHDRRLSAIGRANSCGCHQVEISRATNTVHGEAKARTVEYVTWKSMIGRCLNSSGSPEG